MPAFAVTVENKNSMSSHFIHKTLMYSFMAIKLIPPLKNQTISYLAAQGVAILVFIMTSSELLAHCPSGVCR